MNNEKREKFYISIDKEGRTTAIGGITTAYKIKSRGLIPTSEELAYANN